MPSAPRASFSFERSVSAKVDHRSRARASVEEASEQRARLCRRTSPALRPCTDLRIADRSLRRLCLRRAQGQSGLPDKGRTVPETTGSGCISAIVVKTLQRPNLMSAIAAAAPPRADQRLLLQDLLDDLVADGLVAADAARELTAPARQPPHRDPPAGHHRRPEVEGPAQPEEGAAPRGADRVAGRQGRPALPAHRPVQDRLRRRDQGDVERVRDALQDPADRGHQQGMRHRHLRAVRARVGEGALARPAARDPARGRQPGGHRDLPGGVLQPRPLGAGRLGAEEGRAVRHRQLRAAGAARQERQARRERPPRRPHRRLDLPVRLRAARERHPHGAAARCRQRALPHRRRAASGLPDPHARDGGDDQPHQDPRPHGRGGETPPAGRPHQDRDARRLGGGAAPVDHAHRLRREAGDADLQPRRASSRTSRSSASPTTTGASGPT